MYIHVDMVYSKHMSLILILIFSVVDARLEDWTLTKFNRPKPVRSNTHFLLGAELTRAAQSFGEATQYGEWALSCSLHFPSCFPVTFAKQKA